MNLNFYKIYRMQRLEHYIYQAQLKDILMKKLWFFFLFLCTSNLLSAQSDKHQIEITPLVRMDSYPEFTYSINPVNSEKVKIKGESWGINTVYKFPVKGLFIKAGLGYYRYSFNNIEQINSLFKKSDRRIIDYTLEGPAAPSIFFLTDKYWYHNIVLLMGVEKQTKILKNINLITGLNIGNHFTFSQYYHITYPAPRGTSDKKSDWRYFGFSANAQIAAHKQWNRISVGPQLILPIFDSWKKDELFPEETNSGSRNKWFQGIGLGISFNYLLNKKK